MEFDSDTILQMATLARLHVAPAEIPVYQKALTNMLQLFGSIAALPNTPDICSEQSPAPVSVATEALSRLRPDVAHNTIATNDFLAQVPDREGAFVRVPAILNSTT